MKGQAQGTARTIQFAILQHSPYNPRRNCYGGIYTVVLKRLSLTRLFEQVGEFVEQTMETVGAFALYLRRVFALLFKPPFHLDSFLNMLKRLALTVRLLLFFQQLRQE